LAGNSNFKNRFFESQPQADFQKLILGFPEPAALENPKSVS
jgi:hypothetical protein